MTSTDDTEKSLRPRGEVRTLLLEAARKIFAERGYAGTSTRAISTEAGVAHSLVHFHFPSKSVLFEAAVNQPLIEYLDEFTADAEARYPAHDSLEAECRAFVNRFYDIVTTNRTLLLASLSAEIHPGAMDSDGPIFKSFDKFMRRIGKIIEDDHAMRGVETSMSPDSVTRLTVGMVMGSVLLNKWTFQSQPSRESVIDDIVTYMISGITTSPGTDL
jgi:AcrR family transcriptional regulator